MLDGDTLDIPAFLLRDANNTAEFMKMATTEVEDTKSRPAKSTSKANGVTKPAKAAPKAAVKATDKPKAKAAAKAPVKAKAPAKAPKAAVKADKAPKAPKAPKAEGAKKDKWGFREGSAKSKAVEMYAAKGGATLEEVKEVVGSVQLNVLNALEAEGHEVTRKKEQRDGQRPVTRYTLKFKKA